MAGLSSEIIFEIPKELIAQKQIILKLNVFEQKMKEFVEALIISAEKSETTRDKEFPNIFFRRDFLAEQLKTLNRAHGDSIINHRVSQLKKLKILKTTTKRTKEKKIFIHKISSIDEMLLLPRIINKDEEKKQSRRRTKEMVIAQCDLLKNENYTVLNGNENDKAYHERLLNGILDVTMRLSGKDTRTEITVNTEVAGAPLQIVSKTIGNKTELAKLSDQRCQKAILSLVKNDIEIRVAKLKTRYQLDYPEEPEQEFQFRKEKIDNLFAINIYDLCQEIGLPKKYNNALSVMGMMERLSNTVYDIDASDNEWFQRIYSLSGKSDSIRIQFLQNFEVAKEPAQFLDLFGIKPGTLLPHLYTFSLDPRTFYTLIDPERISVFLSHKGMWRENSGIVQRTYNWSRAFIGGTSKSYLDGKQFDLHDMHSYLIPATRYDNFYLYFVRMLQRFCVGDWNINGISKSIIYGYIYTYDNTNGRAKLSIERDINDPIVGDKSEHQRLLKINRKSNINV
jgi:hypothetical protein